MSIFKSFILENRFFLQFAKIRNENKVDLKDFNLVILNKNWEGVYLDDFGFSIAKNCTDIYKNSKKFQQD